MKKLLVFLLIVCLTGCNTGVDVDHSEDTASNTTEVQTEVKTTKTETTVPVKKAATRFVVFSDRFEGMQEGNINQIIYELNVLSKDILDITAEFIFIPKEPAHMQSYNAQLCLMIESGEVPDIFLAKGLYGFKSSQDSLFNLVQSEVVADLTDLIDVHSPYMNAFYRSYPSFMNFSMVDERIYGIIIPEFALPMIPVFTVKKELCEQYHIDSVTTYFEALDVCKSLASAIDGEDKKIYVENRLCTQAIIDDEGYYKAFSSTFPAYLYLLKKGDSTLTLHRIDKTNVLDAIIIMKEDFERYNIQAIDDRLSELDDFNAVLDSVVPQVNPEEYNIFHLINNTSYYPHDMQLNLFNYFVVSNGCMEKEKAVTYIDWLLGDTQARKLAGFGIRDVNYTFDDQTNIISYTDTPNRLFNIGTGESFALANDVFLDEKTSDVIRKYNEQYRYEERGLLEDLFSAVQGSYSIARYMAPKVSIEIVEKTKELLKKSYDQEFVNALQNALWELN